MNHVSAPVSAVVRLGNRARVRAGGLTAEITVASLTRWTCARGARGGGVQGHGTRLVTPAPVAGAPADPGAGARDDRAGHPGAGAMVGR